MAENNEKYKTFHMSASIKGMLIKPDHLLVGVLTDDDGNELTPREAKLLLMDELEKGHLYIQCGPCDNFDPKKGCLGHDCGRLILAEDTNV